MTMMHKVDQKGDLVVRPPHKDEIRELVPNNKFSNKRTTENEQTIDYDPYAIADFFDVLHHPVNDGLLVGYDENGIPIIISEHDLDTLSDEQLIEKTREDPQFHEFKRGYS